jgi:uncharacterized protein (DUF433 family)
MEKNQIKKYGDRIVSDQAIMHGTPVVKGTRVPVAAVLGYLAGGETVDDVLGHHPHLVAEDVLACLAFAAALADYEAYAL